MRVAICDDEYLSLRNTKKQLEAVYKSLDLLVDTFMDGRELLKAMEVVDYQLIVMDIEMPGMDGLTVARKLRKLGKRTEICFLTSHVEYALKGYEVNAIRYLTKPVKEEQLSEIINFLIERESEQKKLMLKDGEDMVFVPVGDIIYMEAQNQDIRIVTESKEYFRRYNMKDYEEELKSYFFVRCHRGYLVNLTYVVRVSGREVTMNNGERIPMSRMKEKSIKEALLTYVKRSAI